MSLSSNFKNVLSNDFIMEVAKRNVEGHFPVRKFFDNPNQGATEADVWEYASTEPDYIYTVNTGADYYICSSNNADTQIIRVGLLDENFITKTVLVQLQGFTPVKINSTDNVIVGAPIPFLATRCFRMSNQGSVNIAGTIFCVEGNDIGATGIPNNTQDVRAIIDNGNNQTLMCHFTIPANFYALFLGGIITPTKKQSETIEAIWKIRNFDGVFRVQDKLGVSTIGSNIDVTRPMPDIISPKSDLVLTASASGVCGVSGNYNLILIKSEYVNRANFQTFA